ncbi:MAG: hypothetical protein WAQ25_00665 [Candidatus Saccharimonas sp.]
MSNERDTFNKHEQGFNKEQLGEVAAERHKELAAERERSAEKSPEQNAEKARHEALEHASKVEKEKREDGMREKAPAERRGPATKHEREASYNATMKEVRSQMSRPSQVFSTIIHNPVVEKVSDAVGSTIARPNAILSGSVAAFVVTLVIYLVARYYGYPLSGAETIASFALGWALGLIYDYFRLLALGKK